MKPKRKKKRKVHYMVMLLSDASKIGIKQYPLSFNVLRLMIIVVLCLCLVTAGSVGILSREMGRVLQLKEQLDEANSLNAELLQKNEETATKVTILSETITQKVDEEEKVAAQSEADAKPTGFPLEGIASMEEGNAAAEGETPIPIITFSAAVGVGIIASGNGTIVYAGDDAEFGHMIKIDHGNGYISIYRNASTMLVKEGDTILRGAKIYQIEAAEAPLGYQITYEEQFINPLELLEIAG